MLLTSPPITRDLTPDNAVAPALSRSLQTTLIQSSKGVVGSVAAITSATGTWLGASGVDNLQTNDLVQPDDRFQIGSITKPFIATVTLQLAEEGKLNLEDTLDRWLAPELIRQIPNGAQITLRQLLNHTSGIPDYVPSLLSSGINLFREWQPNELVDLLAGANAEFAPGTSWDYSNTNYVLMGLVIEAATGTTVAQQVRSRITDPLALTNTFFAGAEPIPGGTVSGYWDVNDDGRLEDVSNLSLSWAGAAGALVSNAADLVKFTEALFGGKLLKPETLEQMLTFVEPIQSNAFSGYGLGIARLKTTEGLFYGHTGLTLGFRSSVWYSPTEQVIYADLQNTRRYNNLFTPILATWRNDLDRQIIGTDGDNFLVGSSLNDVMHGNGGDDLLTGGLGHDYLWGELGRDRFLLTPGEGIDAIVDFEVGQDLLLLPNLEFADVVMTAGAGFTVVSLAATGKRLAGLIGVTTPLTAEDFRTTLT
jgi:D-alanyl-D-alanine carboxypeptidase